MTCQSSKNEDTCIYRSSYRNKYNRVVSYKSQRLKKFEMIQTRHFTAKCIQYILRKKNDRKELTFSSE